MPAPDAGDTIRQRQARIGMLRHAGDAKVIENKRGRQAAKRNQQQPCQHLRRRPRQGHPVRPPVLRAEERQRPLHEGGAQRENECKVPKLRDHAAPATNRRFGTTPGKLLSKKPIEKQRQRRAIACAKPVLPARAPALPESACPKSRETPGSGAFFRASGTPLPRSFARFMAYSPTARTARPSHGASARRPRSARLPAARNFRRVWRALRTPPIRRHRAAPERPRLSLP